MHVFGNAECDGFVVHLGGDARAQRVVGVVDEYRARRAFQRARNAVLDAIYLAATVELVAEQVEQHHVIRLQMRKGLGQPQLIGLEDAPIRALRMQQRRRHA